MDDDDDETLERAKEGAFREVAAIDAAHASGEIDDESWHRQMTALIVPAYLRAPTVNGGSGHTGTLDDWDYSRGVVGEAIDRSGAFLDVGCANGLLMESLERWGRERGHAIEAHGLDVSPELAELASARVPAFRGRIHVGNALGWRPPRRYNFVRTAIDYVPRPQRRALVAWLLDEVVAEGGRLVIGKHNEEVWSRRIEDDLRRWGFAVTGHVERPHRKEPRLAYRALFVDAPPGLDPALRLRAMREADLPLFARWLAAPHVARWWPPALDLAGVREKYRPRLSGEEPTHMLMVEEHSHPIGWIQWYRWADYPEHAARLGAEAQAIGLDLGIGEPDRVGAGIGPRIVRALIERVVHGDASITACVCDPHADNQRSLRAFAKAGFELAGATPADTDRRIARWPRR